MINQLSKLLLVHFADQAEDLLTVGFGSTANVCINIKPIREKCKILNAMYIYCLGGIISDLLVLELSS